MVVNFPTVYLERQSGISKILDVVSAPLSQPKTTFTQGIKAGAAAVKKNREDISSGRASGLKTLATTLGTTAAAAGSVLLFAPTAATGTAGVLVKKASSFVAKKVITSKAVLGVGAVAILAPKTFSAFIKTPGAAEVAAATAINPIAGIVVGLEKGTSILSTAFNNLKSNNNLDLSSLAVGGVGLGAAAAVGKTIYDKVKSTKLPENVTIPTLPTGSAVTSFGNPGSIVTTSSEPVVATIEKPTPQASSTPNIKIVNKIPISIAIAQ